MDASDYVGLLGGAIGGIAGLVGVFIAIRANRIAADANRISEDSNRTAKEALEAQKANDVANRSANLLPPTEGELRTEYRGEDSVIVVFVLRNQGPIIAYGVSVRLRLVEYGRSFDCPETVVTMGMEDSYDFKFRLNDMNDTGLIDSGTGALVDFVVTYDDAMGHRTKVFRFNWIGIRNTNWVFQLLDVGLDGKRIPFPNAPKLLPGIALFEERV